MQFSMYDVKTLQKYRSNSQIARVLTEKWISKEMYCPCCLHSKIIKYPNNQKSVDFFCEKCKNQFQLKSSKKVFNTKIIDGEYNTMVSFIKEHGSPNFFLLYYSSNDWDVKSLYLISKFFMTLSILEKRKPLSITACRSGWIGCNFLLDNLPIEGKIPIIKNGKQLERENINKIWKKMFFLENKRPELRSWTSDVLNITQELNKEFKLSDIYEYKNYFKKLHPSNNNIKAKIRQQLQILRDNKIIKFKSKGNYEVLE